MSSLRALVGVLVVIPLLIVCNVAIPTVNEDSCFPDNKCSHGTCCSKSTRQCGIGIEFCAAPNCDCASSFCHSCPPLIDIDCVSLVRVIAQGHATVQLAGGKVKTMEELALGDRVAVWAADTGRITHDDVYAFGHKDALVVSPFVTIGIAADDRGTDLSGEPSASLELSPGHFVPTLQSGANNVLYKRAQDVVRGDYVWVTNSTGQAAARMVTDISATLRQGAFNPFTATGNIVVDGVVASVHSDWFLDPLFNWPGILHLLPAVYQALLSPPRVLYVVLGKELYIAIYNALDAHLNLAELGSDHGCHLAATGLVAVLMGIFLTARSARKVVVE